MISFLLVAGGFAIGFLLERTVAYLYERRRQNKGLKLKELD